MTFRLAAAGATAFTVLLAGCGSGGYYMVREPGSATPYYTTSLATSGSAVTLTALNTRCWDGSGNALTSTDVRNIDRVGIQIPSSNTAISVNNFCINKIVFGN